MPNFLKTENINNDSFSNIYNGITKDNLDNEVDKIFKSSGYKIVEGKVGEATYEKGSRTMRILFGAFAKHFLFKVKSYSSESEVKLTVAKATSGIAGGLVGMKQVKNELVRLSEVSKKI